MMLEDALVEGKLYVQGRPVVDWRRDPSGRVELILASEWEPTGNGDSE